MGNSQQGTSTATLNGLSVVGRYYFFSVSVGTLITRSGTQPNNTTLTISYYVSGVDGYPNGTVGLYGANVTFTDAVTSPTVTFAGTMSAGWWVVNLPNNNSGWTNPFFGGGVLAPVVANTSSTLTYTFSMTSTNPDVLGAGYVWHA